MCVPGKRRTRQAARPASVPARGAPLGCAGYRARMPPTGGTGPRSDAKLGRPVRRRTGISGPMPGVLVELQAETWLVAEAGFEPAISWL